MWEFCSAMFRFKSVSWYKLRTVAADTCCLWDVPGTNLVQISRWINFRRMMTYARLGVGGSARRRRRRVGVALTQNTRSKRINSSKIAKTVREGEDGVEFQRADRPRQPQPARLQGAYHHPARSDQSIDFQRQD